MLLECLSFFAWSVSSKFPSHQFAFDSFFHGTGYSQMPRGPLLPTLFQLDILRTWLLWGLSTGGPPCRRTGQGYGMREPQTPRSTGLFSWTWQFPQKWILSFSTRWLWGILSWLMAFWKPIREEGWERENLSFQMQVSLRLSLLKYGCCPHPQLCLVLQVQSHINPNN